MNTSAVTRPQANIAGDVTQLRVFRSEWTKFRSVRST